MNKDIEVPCCRGLSKSNTRSLQGGAFVIAFGAAAALYLYQGGYFPAIQVKQYTCRVSVQCCHILSYFPRTSCGPHSPCSLIACPDHATPDSYLILQEYVASSPLGKSGCLAAFALIFLSEIGDKTFFIAALLAMRVGKWLSFTGSVAALSLMTFVSVGIGVVFKNVPDQFSSSIPIGQYLGIALLVYFGLKTLKVWCSAIHSLQKTFVGTHTTT